LREHRGESEGSEALAEADCGCDGHDDELAHSAPVLSSTLVSWVAGGGKDRQAHTRGSCGSLDG
jgi:hypothetical protein